MTINYETSGSESGDDNNTGNNNTNNNAATNTTASWKGWKERGKQAYLRGDYATALQNYSQALQRRKQIHHEIVAASRMDQQILLSNMVACRLKLGGAAQAEAAIVTAQKILDLDDQWSKGHVRLSEAYLALKQCALQSNNEEQRAFCSDKARESLERAIDLDPSNQSARGMLNKELRQAAVGAGNGGHRETTPEPSAPPEHMDENHYPDRTSAATTSGTTTGSTRNETDTTSGSSSGDRNNPDSSSFDGIEDDDQIRNNYRYTPTWKDRLVFQIGRVRFWYNSLSEDDQTLVKIAVVFVILYVAFGGRFGLGGIGKNNSGGPHGEPGRPYQRDSSTYDDFYASRNRDRRSSSRHRSSSYHDSHYDDGYGYDGYGSRHHRHSYVSDDSSGSLWYLAIVLGFGYFATRFLGLSPFEVLMMVNMLGGRRRGRVVYRNRNRGGWGRYNGQWGYRHRRQRPNNYGWGW